jgi:hypothetical protein
MSKTQANKATIQRGTALAAKVYEIIHNLDGIELFDSLKYFGWCKEFPALIDRVSGQIIDGVKRLAFAEILGIEPVIRQARIPVGQSIEDYRKAINIRGSFSKQDKERIASQLGIGGFSIKAIHDRLTEIVKPRDPVEVRREWIADNFDDHDEDRRRALDRMGDGSGYQGWLCDNWPEHEDYKG